jgi:hypothetical protein
MTAIVAADERARIVGPSTIFSVRLALAGCQA